MKVIFSGLESSGKSLKLAILVSHLVERNAKWQKITGVTRPIFSNMRFSEKFSSYAHERGVELMFWKNIDDLVKIEEADIICDEVGNYFDSRGWENLSLDARRWLSQGAKMGVEFYGGAQDFSQVDIAFRRLVDQGCLKLIRKVAGSPRPARSKPPVKRIWGLCMLHELDPQAYDEDKKKFISSGIVPSFFFISKKYCEIFDTGQKIERSEAPKFTHIKRVCECGFTKIMHV